MIPSDPEQIKSLKELADRNIANGDWGDEISPPGEVMPIPPEGWRTRGVVSRILSNGRVRLPKKE